MIKNRFEISTKNHKLTEYIKTEEQKFWENPYGDESEC